MSNYYTGVGARKTPKWFEKPMRGIAEKLEKCNYILRSGAADGADTYFESGIKDIKNKEIYLPWPKFNEHESTLYKIPNWAFELVENIYNKYEEERIDSGNLQEFRYLKNPIKRLFARNMCQVLGTQYDIDNPDKYSDNYSKFLLCWTPEGNAVGGTRIAIWCAEEHNIPIINMADLDWQEQFKVLFDELSK
jgi:hypothetical protein